MKYERKEAVALMSVLIHALRVIAIIFSTVIFFGSVLGCTEAQNFHEKKIIEIKYTGMLCIKMDCYENITFYEDGFTSLESSSSSRNSHGNLSDEELLGLLNLMEKTNFEKIREDENYKKCMLNGGDAGEMTLYFYFSEKTEIINKYVESKCNVNSDIRLFDMVDILVKKYHQGDVLRSGIGER